MSSAKCWRVVACAQTPPLALAPKESISRASGLLAVAVACLVLLVSPADLVSNARAQEAGQATGAAAKNPPAKSPPAAVRQFRDCIAFQDRGVYDLAADEWEKFLKQFPRDPLAAKAYHYLGLCRLLLKQYEPAAAAFKHAIATYPDSELTHASYLNLGLTQYSLGQAGQQAAYDEAAATLTTLVTRFPKSKALGDAWYYLGETEYARDKKPEALAAYQKALENLSGGALRPHALYALGVTRQELGQPAEAVEAFAKFHQEFPQHALAAEVAMRRAEALFAQRDFAGAEQWFHTAAGSQDAQVADRATLREAASLFEQQKLAAAADRYAAIPEKFPNSQLRVPAMLAAGNCYYLAGNADAAERWLTQVLPAGGDAAAEAAHWLARLRLKNKQAAQALAVVEQVLPATSGSKFQPTLMLDQADAVYELEGRRADAQRLYADLAKTFPQHPLAPQARYMAAFAALGLGDYAAAQAQCQDFLAAYPDHALTPDVRYAEAEAALQRQQYADAAKLFGELVAKYPQQSGVDGWQVRRGLALFLQKQYAEVILVLEPIASTLKAPPLVAQANYLLGSSQLELQQYAAAEMAFKQSLAAEPQGRYADEALLGLAASQRQQQRLPEAIATLEKLLHDLPESTRLDLATLRLADYQAAAGQMDAAIANYTRVGAQWPKSPLAPHAQFALARGQLARKDYQAAVGALNELLDKHPQHALAAKALYSRALAREQLRDYAGASADVTAYLATNPAPPEQLDALYIQGLCAVGQNDFTRAAELFRSILATDPKFASGDKVLYELAWALRSADQPAESVAAFERLAREYADSPLAAESLYHAADHFYQAKDYPQAARNYQAALAKAGDAELGEKAAHKLGWTLYQQGKFDEARQAFATQLERFASGSFAADAQWMTAESLFSQQQYEAAREAYQKSLANPPSRPQFQDLAALHAAQTLAQLKQWEPSLELLGKALKEHPDSPYRIELLFESARAHQQSKHPEQAIELFEQVATDNGGELGARARFSIGEILFDKRDYREAVRNFFKVAYGYGYPQAPEGIRPWQANAAYEAARCFEVLQMTDQAKKSYQEVLDKYPQSDKAPLAQTRLQALGS